MALCSPFVFADSKPDNSNIWLSFAVGTAQTEEKSPLFVDKSNGLSTELAIGYDFNTHLGIYGAYDYVAETAGKDGIHLASAGFKAQYPSSDSFNIFSKVGTSAIISGEDENYDSGFSPMIGIGTEYAFSEALRAQVGLDYHFDLDIGQDHEADVLQAYVGVRYLFGIAPPPAPIVVKPAVTDQVLTEEASQKTNADYNFTKTFIVNVDFEYGSSRLSDFSMVEQLMVVLNKYPELPVAITGHTDSVGSVAFNQKLSEQRAKVVYDYLISNGIAAERLNYSGKGELEPISSNATSEGRKNNRRVEVTIDD